MITVQNLTIQSHNALLTDNVSFSVGKGEKVVLLGQSGSGKTLTSLALMHLLPSNLHQSGTISYHGKAFDESMRGKTLGMIMQSPVGCFDQAFTIGTLFADVFKTHMPQKCTQDFFRHCLADVGLENPQDILNSYPFQLSGGMLQRIMIGLSLALETEFIIADEPTSDIDCLAEQEILTLLKKVEKKRQSLLLITHSIKTACQIADRILLMHAGKILDDFPAAAVRAPNRHPKLKELLQADTQIRSNAWGVSFHE